jgi:hypothetical protein
MQRVTTPKRFYIDHSSDDKIEVRAISCPWPPKREPVVHEIRPPATQAERLFSAGRLVRGGFLRKR